MEITAQQKEELYGKIVAQMITSLENETLDSGALPEIASYLLDHIRPLTTQEQLIIVLTDIAEKWFIFKNIVTSEIEEMKRAGQVISTEHILELTKEGRIDEALALAKKIQQ